MHHLTAPCESLVNVNSRSVLWVLMKKIKRLARVGPNLPDQPSDRPPGSELILRQQHTSLD